jgi:hypothetical protein
VVHCYCGASTWPGSVPFSSLSPSHILMLFSEPMVLLGSSHVLCSGGTLEVVGQRQDICVDNEKGSRLASLAETDRREQTTLL